MNLCYELLQRKSLIDSMLACESLSVVFERIVDECVKAVESGFKIMFFGNGGSAVDAQHLATELSIRFSRNRPAIPAIALSCDASAITAAGNDFGFKYIYSRQVEAIGKRGDVAFCISTSGKSENILHAVSACKEIGVKTIGVTGQGGAALCGIADFCISIPSMRTCLIQEGYMWIGHSLCSAIENRLFPEST